MRRTRIVFIALLPLVLPLLHGCASLGRRTRGETVMVEIENNLQIPTALTIWVYSDVGARQLIGTVSPDRTSMLRFHAPQITGNYRFVARRASQTQGDFLVSNPVALTGGETVTWDVKTNVVLVAL